MASGSYPAAKPARRKTRRTQEERRAETSGRLLDAAIDLLQERGYSRFRIADAAAMAGVSRGGQTHHFGTKNDLIEAAIEHVYKGAVDLARSDANKAGAADILRLGAAHIDKFLDSKLYQVSLNLLISAGSSEHLIDNVREIFARHRQPIEEAWIDRMVMLSTERDEAQDILLLLTSVQRGLLIDRRLGGDLSLSDDGLDFTIEILTEYLNAPIELPV